MSEQYQPAVEIPLVDPENVDPNVVEYCFNPNDFIVGSSAISLDYFNLLLAQQAAADEAAAQATADQIAAQASSMASSDALLASGIAIQNSMLSSNAVNDVVQSNAISALEGNVSLLQDALSTISGGLPSYAPLLNPIFSESITTWDLSMSGNIILGNESTISQEQLSFLSTTSSNIQTQFADLGTSLTATNDQLDDISGAIALRAERDNPVFTTQITCPQITLNGSIITNSTNISPTEISYLNNASSNIQSQIDSTVADIALKCPTNNAALTGTPTCPDVSAGDSSTKIANCNFVSSAISSLISGAPGALDSLQELATAIGNDSNYSTTITTALSTKAPILNASMTGNTSFANIAVSGTTSFPVTSISSAAIENTHFATLTGSQTISGSKAFTALSTVNKMCENFYSMGTLGSSTASIDFANGSCFYMTPMSSANLTLAVSNVPTTNTSCAYSITSMINTSTYKVYGNSCSVNGSGVTLVASGGLSSISVDPSATFVIQQLNVMFDGSSNPSRVISSVNSFF